MNDSTDGLRRILDQGVLARMPVSNGSRGDFEVVEERYGPRTLFFLRDEGPVEVWTRPVSDHPYVIGAHYAAGQAVGFVIDQKNGEQAALIRKQAPAAEVAAHLALAARVYNGALLVPGSIETGFLDAMLHTGYWEERIYKQRALPGVRDGDVGFEITPATRQFLIAAITNAMKGIGSRIIIRSAETVSECRNFVIRTDGTPGAAPGHQDGCVWAAALAVYGVEETRKRAAADKRAAELAERVGRRRRPDYDD